MSSPAMQEKSSIHAEGYGVWSRIKKIIDVGVFDNKVSFHYGMSNPAKKKITQKNFPAKKFSEKNW